MIGAIIGDIVGSRFEFDNIKTKNFEMFTPECEPTDDSIMTIAVADAILKCKDNYDELSDAAVESMQTLGKKYPIQKPSSASLKQTTLKIQSVMQYP